MIQTGKIFKPPRQNAVFNQIQQAWQIELECVTSIGQQSAAVMALVHRIQLCKGKVVLTGVGKSGLLCRRVVASLASIGIDSLFVHAYEAMHGDLGLIRKKDLVIAVSHSGETKEVVDLMDFMKKRGTSTVAITSGENSSLSELADEVIHYPQAESCVYRFLPTSSLTSVNVIFNLVLVGLTLEEGLGEKDLAANHPNGSLGLRFFKKVRDYCRLDCPEVGLEESLRQAVLAVNEGSYGMCFVVDKGNRIGIITSGDIRRALLAGDIDQIRVSEIFNRSPKMIDSSTSAFDTRRMIRKNGVTFLVVGHKDEMLGIVQSVDIL